MTAVDMVCEVCGGESGGEYVGVAAIPGVPMSVAWCTNCLRENAVPIYIAEFRFIDLAGGNLKNLAPWVRETKVWKVGGYVTFEEWVSALTPEQVGEAIRESEARETADLG